jgi:RNA binding exosome subunit
MPTDEDVVETAARAAEDVVFARLDRDDIADYDVTVSFEDDVLEVDVYVNAPDARDADRVADDAALAARGAVDDLFADEA